MDSLMPSGPGRPLIATAAGVAQVPVPELPTRFGPGGIRYDFNEGCRVWVPAGTWRVVLRDLDTGNVLFDGPVSGGMVTSAKRYYVRFGFEVFQAGALLFEYRYDAAGEDVLIRMEAGGLGDQIAWVGHAVAFAEKHRCRVTCTVRAPLIPLLRDVHPSVRLVTADETDLDAYATYKVLIFYNDHRNDWQPCDYRQVGLCHTAAYILGLPPVERRPWIVIDAGGPPIDGPYVCIATQATSQNKYWNNPHGWNDIVAFLKERGYRVVCIDQQRVNGRGTVWNHIPHGAEDETGDRPLAERARWLKHCAFFVGLSSGLSWLAWAAGAPVVMISGFTHPVNEFQTPYRVINYHVCNSCSNDVRLELDPTDFLWCPRHKGTDRMFECTRLVTAQHVRAIIETVPAFSARERSPGSDVPTGGTARDVARPVAECV